jgi:TonB family protein
MLGQIVLAMLVAHASFTAHPKAALQPPASAAQPTADKAWPPLGVFRPRDGVTSPRLLEEVRARYSPDAMRAKIQGSVLLEAVVEPDGTVGEVRVTRSLDRQFGQDDEAVRSLKKWRFRPGTKAGVAVPVLVEVEMSFTQQR